MKLNFDSMIPSVKVIDRNSRKLNRREISTWQNYVECGFSIGFKNIYFDCGARFRKIVIKKAAKATLIFP